jgi:hypothetical protein
LYGTAQHFRWQAIAEKNFILVVASL